MRTILVTGFGPFRDHQVNASWEAVKLLPNEIEDIKLVKVEIPVTYEDVDTKIPALWKDLNPEVICQFLNRFSYNSILIAISL